MTVGKAIKKAKAEVPFRKVKYIDHHRFPDNVFVIVYLTESHPDEKFAGNKIHWEYRMDVYLGEQMRNGISLLSGWKEENEINDPTTVTKSKRKPTIRTSKSTKR